MISGTVQVLGFVLQNAKFNLRHTRLITTTELCSKRFGSYTCTSTHQRINARYAISKRHRTTYSSITAL
jgi:hypothetical protein